MDEKERIIKLLEEGKITAQEATKLLEAIRELQPRGITIMKGVVKGVGEVAESVATLIKEISATVAEKVKEKTKEAAEKIKSTTEEVKKKRK